GCVPVDPAMRRHHSKIHLLLSVWRKKRVDNSVRRHCARSDENKLRWELFQKQFLEGGPLVENCISNFGRQPASKALEPLSYLKKSCLVHCWKWRNPNDG